MKSSRLNKRTIYRGIRIFLVLTIVGISVVFYATGSQKTLEALKEFQWRYFFLACGLIAVDLYAGALRIYIFVRKIVSQNAFSACFKANLANIFLAAATPFQTGGGVAQIYTLNRYGIPYAAGVSVSVLNFVATLSLLFVAALLILNVFPQNLIQNHSLFLIIDVSKLAFYVTFLGFLLFMIRPSWIASFLARLFGVLQRILPKQGMTFASINEKISDFIAQYRGYLLRFWREDKLVLVWNYLLTLILYFNKCLVAYVIFLGLGLRPDFWEVVMLQLLVVFFLYFAPTPGASFVAETSTSAVMALVAPPYVLTLFAVLWRFFTTYFGVLLGSFVLIRILNTSLSDKETELAAIQK